MHIRLLRITGRVLTLLAFVIAAPISPALAQPPSAELAAILGRWQTFVSESDQLEIRGSRIIYNDVFETEKLAALVIRYSSPDSIRLEFEPVPVPERAESQRCNPKTGRPYRLETDHASVWIWTPREFVLCSPGTGQLVPSNMITLAGTESIADSHQEPPPPALPEDPLPWWQEWLVRAGEFYLTSAQQALLPSREKSDSTIGLGLFGVALYPELLLPALFAADSPGFLHDIEWTIAKRTGTTVRLHGTPRSRRYQSVFRELAVIIDTPTGRPLAQRTIDPNGNQETVYVFQKWNAHPEQLRFEFDRKQWDYEVFPLPPELRRLNHRRKK